MTAVVRGPGWWFAARAALRRATAPALVTIVGLAGASCADKGVTPTSVQFGSTVSLQVTITANQQAAFGPQFLIAVAGFEGIGDDEGGYIGFSAIRYSPGAHKLIVPVDLARCLAYFAARRRGACQMLIGAAIVGDTAFLSDTSTKGDPFDEAFDFFFAGPFSIGSAGALPTVPPIDLSASRFAVVKWEGDDALRLGGNETPGGFTGRLAGVPGAGTAPPTLFAVSAGMAYPATTAQDQFAQGPYPLLAVFANGSWKRYVVSTLPFVTAPNAAFTDVTAPAANEAYLAHRTGLYRWDGSGVTKVSAVTDSIVSVGSVTVGATRYVIAGGWNGIAWTGNGQSWQRHTLPLAHHLNGGVCITGPAEAFAASQSSGGLFRFDGTAWTSVPIPATGGKTQLQCPAPGQAFVTTIGGLRYAWNGSTWVSQSTAGLPAGRAVSVAVVSPTEMYAAGDSASVDRAFYRFNGTSWQEVGRLRVTGSGVQPWADPRGSAYFASPYGRVERVAGTAVSVVGYAPTLRDVMMTSLTSAFVVGHNAFLARWDGTRWKVDQPPAATPTNRNLRGVWTDGPNNAWAVGDANTIYRFSPSGWSVLSAAAQPVAVPDNYNGVWGIGSDVWIVGDQTVLRCKVGGACFNEATGASTPLYSVWGTSNANLFAVGAGGRIVRSNGSTWSVMASPTSRTLNRVSGSGPSDVWAVGDSVMLHFDGTQWSVVTDTRSDLNELIGRGQGFTGKPDNVGMWVRGPKEMYFTSGYGEVGRYDGTYWSNMGPRGYRHTMMGISGLTTGCALGVTETFSDAPSPTLWRGIGPTGCLSAPMPGPTAWP